MPLRVRGAFSRDIAKIQSLIDVTEFKLDTNHLQMLVVIEDVDSGEIVAAGSLVTILEAMLVTNPNSPRKERVEALSILVDTLKKSVSQLGYELAHGFVKDDLVVHTLKKHYGFQDGEGKNLVIFS